MRDEKEVALIERIAHRAFVFATKMIFDANNRDDEEEGDPKVGGHPAACSSCVHIMSALHLGVRQPQDWIAVKPHGSPVDHSLNHLLGLFHVPYGREWLSDAEARAVMTRLRKFSQAGEPVFQSYHAESDPDGNAYFPSGSVGIPPVMSMYTSLAYRYAKDHGMRVPEKAHFWSLIGDSEFREGSLMEAMPDAAERELGDVTWIVDYNRQNLDGTRIPNKRGLSGTDSDRMERVAVANGWDVIQCQHGRKRLAAFKRGGEALQKVLEQGFSDYEFQMLLLRRDGAIVRDRLIAIDKKLERFLEPYTNEEVYTIFADLGGHDIAVMLDALRRSKLDPINPTLIIAHTIKGWGLSSYAAPGNHSALTPEDEVDALLASEGLTKDDPYALYAAGTEEAEFLDKRRTEMRAGMEAVWKLKDDNLALMKQALDREGDLPHTLGVNLKLLPLVHTQYVWGQLAAKLIRIGTTYEMQRSGVKVEKPLSGAELRWGPAADLVLTMAPDVGTSTNINPAMDDRIYGPDQPDYENELGVRDPRRPQLTPSDEPWTRHIRFEIAEANCMSAAGAFGKMREHVGVPFLPVMTIYDFFIKRAFDQLYYNLYWGSSFIVVGTPSGITLAPEGAQHSWKSDIAMPNIIIWEPFYAVEVDWVLAESVRRHYLGENKGRSGVVIRAVTRAFRQAEMLARLKKAVRFQGQTDEAILEATRLDAIEGAYYLVDWRGYEGYEPGENVVHILSMGAMGSEALAACDLLLEQGIFANVIVVTSGDLLVGNLAHENGYRHLKETLDLSGDVFLTRATNGNGAIELRDRGDMVLAAGRRVPIIALVDGEPGILDNVGSVVGVRAETLAVRKASKSGRPSDVYRYHHLDGASVRDACLSILSDTALENVRISRALVEDYAGVEPTPEEISAERAAIAPIQH